MGHRVLRRIETTLRLEKIHQVLAQTLVEIVAAQMVVAGSCQNLDNAATDFDYRHVERAAAKVVHHDFLRIAVVEAIRQRRRGGLVDDAQHV